jgi:signal transduction histidine kinase
LVATEDTFTRFVSLACHDLRTPLATVSGFAYTLQRGELDEPAARYVAMIEAASEQIAELLDDLGLVARIEGDRYEPNVVTAGTRELADAAATQLGEQATAGGNGTEVRVDRDHATRALAAQARCALRHGGLEAIGLAANGSIVEISPIVASAAPVVLGEDLKDLGAATARRVVEALGGSLSLEGERLLVRLPAA